MLEWDVTRYADKLRQTTVNSGTKAGQAAEASLRRRYPLLNGSVASAPISRPCIVVDMQGIILVWYLPRILKDSRKVSFSALSDFWFEYDACQREMMVAMEKLTESPAKSRKRCPSESQAGTSKGTSRGTSWHV
jgi:hypothetical protein